MRVLNPPTLQQKKKWILPEQLLSYIIFEQLYCYEVTLVKKYNKPLLQKSETKISTKKRFIKNLLKINEKKNSGVLRLNQIMFKLLTISKCSLIASKFTGCLQLLHCFEHAEHFHISHFTYMVILNEPIKIAHLQKLANQSMVNGALVIEMINNSFSESKKNFGSLMKR